MGGFAPFGDCTVTCGGGTRERNRICHFGYFGQDGCKGKQTDISSCNDGPCRKYQTQFLEYIHIHLLASWSSWRPKSPCTVTCGTGERIEDRICEHGKSCPGNDERSIRCNEQQCRTYLQTFNYKTPRKNMNEKMVLIMWNISFAHDA